jgi:hypothetical protein
MFFQDAIYMMLFIWILFVAAALQARNITVIPGPALALPLSEDNR